MPYCDQSSNGIRIFYRRCGHGSTKVLLIIGLAGTHDSWGPQIKGLTGAVEPNDEEEAPTETVGGESNTLGEEVREGDGIEVCCFDNRGVGRSSVPTEKSDYTTTIMAEDALALLDHLGWKNAHVFGHSMGAMIACKLAAMAPDRICSLALLNVTGGGFECFPKDYVKAISSSGMQSNYGFEGQLNACWTHNMTSKELETIRSSGFLVTIIHGRDDIIAQLDHARRLAKKLQPVARMVELHGAHLVSHERPEEVNLALMELIKASKSKLEPEEWSHLAESESDEKRADKYESKRDTDLVT
ncbi:hydrolase, alpha beta fold family domain containing protein [Musa troglodytarum]|uniref:Hydrolase, alpha beta fold family domain containing protein n=1 Tax=Musa troglodytarum TaxID=320322 RepID=A0A9E7KEU2_9LILI|nr:hydrolase, alpha beta fold family domain containing protein [Musa troglodytarum]